MNRPSHPSISEAVLAGHPDRWCDHLADLLVEATTAEHEKSYAQIEVAAWREHLFVTGEVWNSGDEETKIRNIARNTIEQFTRESFPKKHGNRVDPPKWKLVCQIRNDVSGSAAPPAVANDQAVVTGYAWSGPGCNALPPAHFLARRLAAEIDSACRPGGELEDLGPDGKLLVRLHPFDPTRPHRPASMLLTIQHPPSIGLLDVSVRAREFVFRQLEHLDRSSDQWSFDPEAFRLEINPNGDFHRAGFLADNGQTGRKLVFDYYGPSVPIGGGALHGKSLSHVDRAAALRARKAAVILSRHSGAREALVTAAYQPGIATPIWTEARIRTAEGWQSADSEQLCRTSQSEFLAVGQKQRGNSWYRLPAIPTTPGLLPRLAREGHFFNPGFSWNQG